MRLTTKYSNSDQLADLYQAAGLGERSSQAIALAFKNSRYRLFAIQSGRLIGACRAFGDEVDCAVICDLAVHPEFQNEGLGDQLLDKLKRMVRHHKRIILYARSGKEGFYLKRGFHRMKTAMLASFTESVRSNREKGLIE